MRDGMTRQKGYGAGLLAGPVAMNPRCVEVVGAP